jgi:hypothetical protein
MGCHNVQNCSFGLCPSSTLYNYNTSKVRFCFHFQVRTQKSTESQSVQPLVELASDLDSNSTKIPKINASQAHMALSMICEGSGRMQGICFHKTHVGKIPNINSTKTYFSQQYVP